MKVVEELKYIPEFIALKRAKSELKKNLELMKSVEQFIEDNARFHSQAVTKPDYEKLNRRFNELNKIPEVQAYFQAGSAFENMLGGLYQTIGDLIAEELEKKD